MHLGKLNSPKFTKLYILYNNVKRRCVRAGFDVVEHYLSEWDWCMYVSHWGNIRTGTYFLVKRSLSWRGRMYLSVSAESRVGNFE